MKKLEFGMPTLIELATLEENVDLCKELGLSFVELNMNLPQYQMDCIDMASLKEFQKRDHIYFTLHLDEKLSVADFNLGVAKAYVDTVLAAIQLAKELNIPVLNMHFDEGVHFKLPDRKVFLYDYYKDAYLVKLSKFHNLCEQAIGNHEIKICIENCSGWRNYAKEGIELLLESKVFALTLDIGHSYCANGVDEEFIKMHLDRLSHMHLHDATKEAPHLALGTGEICLEEQFHLAKECSCRCVLETKNVEGLRKSVKFIELRDARI